jgi:acetyl-CoA C-acetyltransferase
VIVTRVFLVDGGRTPFLKYRGVPGPFSASDLAVTAAKALLLRHSQVRSAIAQSIWGCVAPQANELNIARLIALRSGLGVKCPAFTVQRNCASGMQALACAVSAIESGDGLVLCGGTEAMSRSPVVISPSLLHWWGSWSAMHGLRQKWQHLKAFRAGWLSPQSALRVGLIDPFINMSMGQTAEVLATEFGIDREAMDTYALRSHQQAIASTEKLVGLWDQHGQHYARDTGVRDDTSLVALAKLPAVFEPPCGRITAGNSAQVSDGAVSCLLASEQAIKRHDLPVMAEIVAVQWSGCAPETMGLGPVFATTRLLQRAKLDVSDIAVWEINEAFAGQVLSCLAAWADKDFCRQHLGLHNTFACLDSSQLNTAGGALAIGHPVGASGARIVLQCAQTMQQTDAEFGVATMCIGGGQGGAVLLKRVGNLGASHGQ